MTKRAILLVSVLLLGALAVWRLTSAPIPINFVTPYLNELLSRNQDGWSLQVGETVLAWRGWSMPLDLSLRDVEVRDVQGRSVVELPVVSVGLGLSALVRGRLAASRVEILHAELRIYRDEAGQVAMQGEGANDGQDVTDFGLMLAGRLLAPRDPEDPVSFLDRLRVEADRITWEDRKGKLLLSAAPATVDMRRTDTGMHCEVTLQLGGEKNASPSGPRLQITADARRTAEDGPASGADSIDLEAVGLAASLVARVHNVPVAELGRYWPQRVADDARSWVTQNVRSGNVREAMLNLAFERENGQSHLRTLGGTLTYADLAVAYLDGWPEARSVAGSGTFDRRGLRFQVESGVVGDLRVGPTKVAISGLDSDKERIDIHAPLSGPSNAIAGLVASRSSGLADFLALHPGGGSNAGTVDLKLGFPLYDGLSLADVTLTAAGDLPGLQTDNPYVQGPVPATVEFEMQEGAKGSLEVVADLSQADMTIPFLGWHEREPAGGKASWALDLKSLQPTAIRDLKIEAGTLQGRGSVRFQDDGRWDRLELEDVSIGRTKLRTVVVEGSSGRLRAELGPGEVDVEAIRKASDGEKKGAQGDPGFGDLVLIAPALRRVSFAADRYLEEVTVHAEHDRRGWRNVAVSGRTPGDRPGKFEVVLKPTAADRQQLVVHADDCGSLFKVLGVTSEVRGGRLDVSGETSGGGLTPLQAHVEMRNYAVLRSSLLTRLLTFASGRGFVKRLSDDAIDFDYLQGNISFSGGRATTENIRTHGPAMGITVGGWVDADRGNLEVSGAIVPAYTANRILGKIPVFGSLLSGDGDEGFWAIRYRMQGDLADPKMEVDTLKSLTPALLREIFGTLEAATGR